MRERACRAASRIAWIAVALPVAAAPSADGTSGDASPYSCTFQSSLDACGFYVQAKDPARITPVEVAGIAGVRLQTLPGDEGIAGSGRAERTDLSLSSTQTGCSQGEEQWWSHALLFPDDYVAPRRNRASDPWPWGVVFDFHQTGHEGQANFQIDITGDPPLLRFAISGGAVPSSGAPGSPTQRWPIGPVRKNHWYEFVYHVRWSSGSDGFFDARVDGREVMAYRGPTLYAGQSCYLKLANYHTPVGSAVSVVHARLQRAATEAGLGLH